MFGKHKTKTASRIDIRSKPRLEQLDARDVPAVIAVPDTYSVAAGQTLTVPIAKGVLANDFSTTTAAAVLIANLKAGPTPTQPPVAPALPGNALTLFNNGGFTFTAPSTFNPANNPVTFTYEALDLVTGETAQATVSITITGAENSVYAVASGPGIPSEVRAFDSDSGLFKFAIQPYEPGYTAGIRVATGDLNNDGTDDIVTVPDFGGAVRIQIFDGKFGTPLANFFAFEDTFRGGGYVAIGDVNGDTTNDLIVGAGESGGPRVQVFTLQVVGGLIQATAGASFFAYEDTFRNGVRVAAGDLDNDGIDEVVTGAGPGGGPAVKVFGPEGVFAGVPNAPVRQAFFAFDSAQRGGVNVAVGQFRGDGKADIVAGSGNGAAVVRVFDGRNTAFLRELAVPSTDIPTGGQGNSGGGGLFGGGSGTLLGGVGVPFGLNPAGVGGLPSVLRTGGARIGVTDRDGDGLSDIVVGQGAGNQPRVRIFTGNDLVELSNQLAFSGTFAGGVYVGGNSL